MEAANAFFRSGACPLASPQGSARGRAASGSAGRSRARTSHQALHIPHAEIRKDKLIL